MPGRHLAFLDPTLLLAQGLLIILSATGSPTLISDLELDRCRGKGEQSQAKKSTGGSSGVGRAEGLLLVGAVQLRLHQALQGSEGEEWRGALCAGLPSLIRKSQAHAASSCQLAAPPRCFIIVTSTLPFLSFLSFLSQIVGWEMSKCRSLGCMGGIFVACSLSCPFAPGGDEIDSAQISCQAVS